MAIRCAGCGEELMGAVNRCWRCGKRLVAQAGSGQVPPIRRAPIPRSAVVGSPGQRAAILAALAPDESRGRASGNRASDGEPPTKLRRGSPFADSASESPAGVPPAGSGLAGSGLAGSGAVSLGSPPSSPPSFSSPWAGGQSGSAGPAYPRHAAAVGGAIAALGLRVMSLLVCWFTHAAIITGLLGLGMGIWGLYSTRRGLAAAGVIVCLVALAISSFYGAVDWYTHVYETSPFAPGPATPGAWPEEPSLPSEL